MTIPRERTQAIQNTRSFLYDLLDERVSPQDVRRLAYVLLRHYPSDYEIDRAAEKCPDIFAKTGEGDLKT